MTIDEDILNDKHIIIDKNSNISLFSPVCSFCKNYIGYRVCEAFDKIPINIWNGVNQHLVPIINQKNNIIFEEKEL